ncbi:acetylxylan esterase [Bacillus sp. REN3]|uniref:acetylxylan esterase n=1 Tax=Bacillus sp. REN3 TaxID=2802440 RepID=UPI001AED239B|nr:acetylxylan esterase [Bacillus sp. REN3]
MGRNVADFTLQELKAYKPKLNRPKDFMDFWEEQKKSVKRAETTCEWKKRIYPVKEVEVFELLFTSWDSTPLKGILVKPAFQSNIPVMHSFHGYTGDRGLPADFLKWALMGIAVISFDIRGQGTSPDFAKYPNGSRTPGWMLNGILQKENYYYVNIVKDILAQLNWAKDSMAFDISKFGVMGSSQGGGLALSAAGLEPFIDFIIADWPFATHFERALEVATNGPYMEIVQYFKNIDPHYETYDQVIGTLSYIDALHFCPDITKPVLMGIGLEDSVTPPSTAFAAFNHIASKEKVLEVYPQFTHEPNPYHEEKRIEFICQYAR